MIILLVLAIAAVATPMAGVLLVSLASRREDAAFSLSRQPTGALQAATRRLLNFHGDGPGARPAGLGGTGARPAHRTGDGLAGDGRFRGEDEFAGDEFAGDGDNAAHLAGLR
jgi:hypothetical protein